MKGCLFITMKDSMYGFSLAGFQQVTADRNTLVGVFEEVVNTGKSGLVFIDERLLAENNLRRLYQLEKQWGGVFVSLPSPGSGEEAGGVDHGKRFIARVLGYQMKLS